jgi:uncharacterized protein (DUF983 family)
MIDKYEEEHKEKGLAHCSHCYEGWIVQEKLTGVFYCAICKKEVHIQQV